LNYENYKGLKAQSPLPNLPHLAHPNLSNFAKSTNFKKTLQEAIF
jgi:hypothetical protein